MALPVSITSGPNRKREQIVLEEDEYIEAINKIIERDFFPSLHQKKIFQTESGKDKTRINLSLNAFLARYTSKDNASFESIMKEVERRHKEKYPWLYLKKNKMLMPDESKDVGQIHSNKYTTIFYENTRFKRNPFSDHLSETVLAEAAACNLKHKSGKIGIDGKELTDDVPNIGGYSLVPLTPSPAPGVNTTPLMTWGQIEGTPYSLDGGATPTMSSSLLPSNTPHFKIPDVPEREKIGHALADKITRNNRDKRKEALKQAQYLRKDSMSPRYRTKMGSDEKRKFDAR